MCFQDVPQAYINIAGLLYAVILELKLADSFLATGQDPTLVHLVLCTSVPHLVQYVGDGNTIRPPPGPPPRA